MNDLAERLRGEAEANEAAIDAEVAFFPSRLLREAADRLEALSTHIELIAECEWEHDGGGDIVLFTTLDDLNRIRELIGLGKADYEATEGAG